MVNGAGNRGRDLSRQIEKNPKLLTEMDLNKGVRRPTQHAAHESVHEGVTSDSIAEFMASRENPGESIPSAPTGLFGALKKFFRR